MSPHYYEENYFIHKTSPQSKDDDNDNEKFNYVSSNENKLNKSLFDIVRYRYDKNNINSPVCKEIKKITFPNNAEA